VDRDRAYRLEGWASGIAWRVIGFHKFKDEDYEWSGIECVDESRVDAHMIGDDQVFVFDVEELIPINDDEYCSECGQIGCTANG
jgi:hypothetical protein